MLRVMMNTRSGYDLSFDGPALYRIRVSGQLSARWSERLGDMTITVFSSGTDQCVTSLVGELSDQADLAGVLNSLYELHLPVLSVECLNPTP